MTKKKSKYKPIPPKPPLGNQFAKGHGFGRPKIYTPEFIEQEAQAFLEWIQNPEHIWMEDFALERGYSPKRLYEFAKTNPVFSEVLEYVQHWQKSKLVKGGLVNDFNSGFCKFVLGNTSGWSDKTQVSGDNTNPLQFLIEKVDGGTRELVNDE